MQVIPAIDIMDGNVVRLRQGRRDSATVYSREPREFAERFKQGGAEWLHVVDLDAAFGTGNNSAVIREICSLNISVQVGGGIRNAEQGRRLISAGASRVIIGSAATVNAGMGKLASALGKRMWVACDSRKGRVATDGWEKDSRVPVEAFLKRAYEAGVGGAVVTDISNDGMLAGISGEFFSRAKSCCGNLRLIASGGVSTVDDLRKLSRMGYEGAIVGKALYEGKINLKKALEVVSGAC